jgi:hypothetical protein
MFVKIISFVEKDYCNTLLLCLNMIDISNSLGPFFIVRCLSTPALCYVGLLVFQRFAMCVLASILIIFFSCKEYQGLEIEC